MNTVAAADLVLPLQQGYSGRPVGPHAGAELLCPYCGALLAVGWLPGWGAVTGLGPAMDCTVCRAVFPTGEVESSAVRPYRPEAPLQSVVPLALRPGCGYRPLGVGRTAVGASGSRH